jgi:uncharacterized protein (DUF433 family)
MVSVAPKRLVSLLQNCAAKLDNNCCTDYLAVMTFERITIDPAVCTGKPCIRGLRFPVARLLGLFAAGETREAILANYPYLESEDIDEALHYGAFLAEVCWNRISPSLLTLTQTDRG